MPRFRFSPPSSPLPPRYSLLGLALATLLITAWLTTLPAFEVQAFQSNPETDTPTPTDTPKDTPTPTYTPIPTDTPTPVDTLVPPTDTPFPTDTPQPGTPTALPPTDTPVLPTNTPVLPTNTPLPEVLTPTPTAIVIPPTPTPTLLPGQTPPPPDLPIIIIPEGEPPADDTENLIRLIDTFVLYSAYFLLGCGLIVFVALALGLWALHRRAEAMQTDDEEPLPPDEYGQG